MQNKDKPFTEKTSNRFSGGKTSRDRVEDGGSERGDYTVFKQNKPDVFKFQDEDFAMKEKIITYHGHNIRADRLLKIKMNIGRILACKSLRKGNIVVNGVKIDSPSHEICDGDVVTLKKHFFAFLKNSAINTAEDELDSEKKQVCVPESIIKEIRDSVVFENDKIMAINKPYGLASQLGGSVKISLDVIMKVAFGDNLLIVHRLDKETSGLMIFAKDRNTAKVISDGFVNGSISKVYLAIVHGEPELKSGTIDASIIKLNGKNMYNVTDGEDGLKAVTEYKVIKTENNTSLLELEPKTGRTHQLRIHCAKVLNTPIIGDSKYGERELQDKAAKMQLCSYKISLPKEIQSEQIVLPNIPSFFSIKTDF
ncbi:MAG: RluA family pseudouridine synthase [Alphaproteobacteria bacterium]|nr:RluA family pseudouridine synthase [Rickettsiales bacterium]